jgi:hypothetical protein
MRSWRRVTHDAQPPLITSAGAARIYEIVATNMKREPAASARVAVVAAVELVVGADR